MKIWNQNKCRELLKVSHFITVQEFEKWCQDCIDELKSEMHGGPDSLFNTEDSAAPEFVHRANLIALQLRANDLAVQCDRNAIKDYPDAIRMLNECIKWCHEQREESAGQKSVAKEEEKRPTEKASQRYYDFARAEREMGRRCTDQEAYDWLKENGPECDLPDNVETWSRDLRKVRTFLGEQKNTPRANRSGRSMTRPDQT